MIESKANQKGFTIIELIIATTVFSVVLLLCTFGLMQIGNVYYRGITSTRTQNVTRNIIDMVSQDIELSDNGIIATNPSVPSYFCAGHHRYSYMLGKQLDETTVKHVLVVDDTDCSLTPGAQSFSSPTVYGQELLGKNMRLADFSVTAQDSGYQITVKVIYGDDDLLRDGMFKSTDAHFDIKNANCAGGAGSQFCAVSMLSTYVIKRL